MIKLINLLRSKLDNLSQSSKAVILVIIFTSLIIGIVGIKSDISLGDEVYQFRFAKLWYETGQRPVYDPLLETSKRCLYFFDSDPLWAMGLISIWKVIGGISKPMTQVYQAAYYGILVLATYLLGKQIYSSQIGLYSAIIVATTPFFAVYSVMEYIDVPAVALTMVAYLFLAKKKYFWAGLIAGLSFLMKRNTWLLIPPLGIYLLLQKESRFKNIFMFALPAGLVTFYELAARLIVWGSVFYTPGGSDEVASSVLMGDKIARFPGMLEIIKSILAPSSKYSLEGTIYLPIFDTIRPPGWNWTPSNITFNPLSIPIYVGVVLLVFLIAYILLRRQKSRDFFLILPIVAYFIEYLYFFRSNYAVRYIVPILGFLAILAAIALLELISSLNEQRRKIILMALLVVCILQFGASLARVFITRQFSNEILEAYQFIKTELPVNARLIYPEYSLSEETGRPMIWIRIKELPYLFWEADEQQALNIFHNYEINYIMIKKDRIYDDTYVKHRLGYPITFINKLHSFPSLKRIYENGEVEILKIALSK